MVTGDRTGADVLLSVLFDLGLVGVIAGGGDTVGDFDPRPEPAGGGAAASADPTPASS
jgi:hypothetical protein